MSMTGFVCALKWGPLAMEIENINQTPLCAWFDGATLLASCRHLSVLKYFKADPLELGGHIFGVIGRVPQGCRFVGAVTQYERHPVFCGLSKVGVTENDQENEDVA